MPTPFDLRPGFGSFRIDVPADQEKRMIDEAKAKARANATRPGHWWWRVTVADAGVVRGIKEYHVDLEHSALEIRESWDDRETAWRTLALEPTN